MSVTVNQLSSISASEMNGADSIIVYSTANGDTRRISNTNYITYLKSAFARQDYVTTVSTPANGFTETVTDDGLNRWVLLRPTGSLATGTIVLPSRS